MRTTIFLLFISYWIGGVYSQDLSSTVSLIQGKKTYCLSFEDTTLTLRPEEFRFQFEINNSEGIFVAASPKSEYYITQLDSTWNNWEFTQDMVAAEEDFNTDKDLIVGHESFKYWFFTPEKLDWHRFDKDPTVKGNTIHASYTIDKIFDLDNRQNTDLSNWKDPIYILFFQTSFDENKQVVFPVAKKRVTILFSE